MNSGTSTPSPPPPAANATATASAGANAPTPSHGSRTMVIHATASREAPPASGDDGSAVEPIIGILSLTGARMQGGTGRIQWDESVVDNEGMGKKSSKICCIFRKQRNWDESDSDSSEFSSSDDDSDDDSDSGQGNGGGKGQHDHSHDHGPGKCNHGHGHKHGKPRRRPGPNAYERQPKYKKRASPTGAGPDGL
ncbi:phosphatase inhibitor-domain-containing protein [Catenaria anguillulae PL171]|uniref:Type 1 phosphatases regulator n=1 Tax=Catenaria anguillulae PL171 TaxID=765915 RepID=A0A1Y2HEN6_9FUNG|nr:phosphatase inhibitor-domain-containing protein [Catenaria anguillulae PL171]